ncbi:thymine dioxygenase [Mycena olivaceomarginata]|nr:thymine dioxygenase [Mycena olivaceomarginata]
MDEGTLNASAFQSLTSVPFLDGSNKQEVAGKMVSSFKEIGSFFAQPMEVKKLAPHPPSGTHHRGYSSPGQEKVVQHVYHPDAIAEQRAQAPDVKESFECGREGDGLQPNIWLPDGCPPGVQGGVVPAEALETEKIARIGQHSDFGSITLLLQDDVGGLEVEDPNVAGSFCPAPPIPGSNDTIRSTIHRVRAPPPKSVCRRNDAAERYSIPYDFSTVVDCIPGTWSAERPKKYEPISAQEYIMKRMAATY